VGSQAHFNPSPHPTHRLGGPEQGKEQGKEAPVLVGIADPAIGVAQLAGSTHIGEELVADHLDILAVQGKAALSLIFLLHLLHRRAELLEMVNQVGAVNQHNMLCLTKGKSGLCVS
jgi:hypothetical protein